MGNDLTQPAIDGIGSAVTLGVLPFPVPAQTVVGIAALGSLIKASLSSNDRGVTVDHINKLNRKMEQLSDTIRDNNANLRKLIVEHEFTYIDLVEWVKRKSDILGCNFGIGNPDYLSRQTNVIVEVETMEHLMRDVMKFWTAQSIQSFNNFCSKNDPHHLTIKILKRLNHDVTNPLIFAMEADKLRTKATFETWRKTINNLLGTLQMAHAFHEGLHFRKATSEAMESAISQVKHKLDRFIAEYKPNYWPHVVEQVMRETADRYHGWNYEVIADKVRDALDTIYTTDEFYVIVYNQCTGHEYHTFTGNHIAQFRRGGCNMVVARSKSVHYRSDGEKTHMSHEVMTWAKPEHIVVRGREGMRASRDHIYKAIEAGFVGLIDVKQNIHIRWTGGNHLEPGRWTMCPRYEEYDRYSSGSLGIPSYQGKGLRLTSDVMLIVGFN